jgi:hypothetical protein
VVALHNIASHVARGSTQARMVVGKRALIFRVVVPPVAQRVVRTNDDVFVASGELDQGELLFVVFLKRGFQLALYRVFAEDVLDGYWESGDTIRRSDACVWRKWGGAVRHAYLWLHR